MMDWTDRHCRVFHRLLTRRARLYTEMLTTGAVIHGQRPRLLGFDPSEHPVALQLGGSDPGALAEAAAIGAAWGYDEINLNVGCPSDRVQSGRFGACLMAEPDLVADCVAAMIAAVDVPVTVKCRLGIDDQDPADALFRLAAAVAEAGCRTVIVHARKAWLAGLSPKENRDIPPLDYALVYRLKDAMPALGVVINGGIGSLDEAERHLRYVDGVMLGRAAYQSPALLADVDKRIFGDAAPAPALDDIVHRYADYAARMLAEGVPLAALTHPLVGLFHAVPGARAWRRHVTEAARRPGAGIEILHEGLAILRRAAELVAETRAVA